MSKSIDLNTADMPWMEARAAYLSEHYPEGSIMALPTAVVTALLQVAKDARELYELVERDESVGVCLSDRVPSLCLRDSLCKIMWGD